jgi:hypothetical protein
MESKNRGGKMNCEGKTEKISQYIDGELSKEEKEELEKHLLSCQVCQKEMEKLRKVKEAVVSLGLPEITEEEDEALLKRIEEKTAQQRKYKWLIPAAIIPIAAAFLFFFLVYPFPFLSQKTAPLKAPKSLESEEARKEGLSEKREEVTGGEALKEIQKSNALFFKDLEEAQEEVGYPLQIPEVTLGGKITEIMVSPNKPLKERSVSIYYDNGLELHLIPKSKPPDYAGELERLQAKNKKSQIKEPSPVKINGKSGIAGYYYSPSFGSYPGYIIWFDEGIEYFLNYHGSPEKSFTFKEFLKVASSVKEIKSQ